MSHKDLYNPHLKENPFTVPEGYFEEVQARWALFTAQVEEHTQPASQTQADPTAAPERAKKDRPFIKLLLPQLQFAAAFLLLFGLGYLFVATLTKNRLDTPPADEMSVLNEWAYWGIDHHTLYDWVQEGIPENDNSPFLLDVDIEDLLEYMDYPGFDPVHLDLNSIYDIRHLP